MLGHKTSHSSFWQNWNNIMHLFSFYFLNYESMITQLQETWKIQNKVTYSSFHCQFSSVTQSCPIFATTWPAACQASLFTPTPGVYSDHVHWVGNAIQSSHPLSSPSPALNPSHHQDLFQWVSSSHQVASFNISPSNEYSGLISFRMDWLDLLAVQRTLKSLLQHHTSKASIHRCSAFFTVQLSHPYMTTGKTIALARWTFVDKVMSLLFNMLSRLDIAFLPRSKCLLISWLQSPSVWFWSPEKLILSLFPLFPLKWWDGCLDLSFPNVEF